MSVASYVQKDINKKEMAQIASNVSVKLMEIAILATSSNFTIPLVKTIDIPTEVGGRAYFVELVNASAQGKGYLVMVSLVAEPSANVNSSLPFNSTITGLPIHVTTSLNPLWGGATWDAPARYPAVTYINGDLKSAVYGGNDAVVWARKDGQGILYLGIGYLK